MISFAQNFEDVMLWRAFKGVSNGFYVDIGAQDPVVDSVSRGLYELGWRGVHVEPVPQFAQALRDARPDETVVQAAIGLGGGSIPFFEIPNTGISTGDAELAAKHEASGYAVRRTEVPSMTLAALFESLPAREIHWLKIDVEGMEGEVLRSWAPSTVRPWVVLVEATTPRTAEPSWAAWEPSLRELGYRFVYSDGLNRFYLSESHPELAPAFTTPPNVFDAFSLSGSASNGFCFVLNQNLERAQTEKAALAGRLELAETVLATERKELAQAQQTLREQIAQLAAKDAALDAQRRQLVDLSARLDRATAVSDDLTRQVQDGQRALDALHAERSSLEQSLTESRAAGEQLARELATQRARADQLQAELERSPQHRVRALLAHPRLRGLLARGTPEPVEEAPVMNTPAKPAPNGASVASLLTHYDVDFVREVYAVLLGREADPLGLEHYLTRLRQGDPRESVIVDIARSDEAKKVGREVVGLSDLLRDDDERRTLGRRLQRSLGGESTELLARAVRSQENRAAVTTAELHARLGRLEETLASAERANEVWRALAQGDATDHLRQMTQTREHHRRLQDELFNRLKAALGR